MHGEGAPLWLTISGDAADYVRSEALRLGAQPDEIGRRALAIYGVLIEQLETTAPVLLQPLESVEGLPDLIRVDEFAEAPTEPLMVIETIGLTAPKRSRLMPWPPRN